MTKYHINPETGNPNICRAKSQCPFGGEDSHYDNKADARVSFEQNNRARLWPEEVNARIDALPPAEQAAAIRKIAPKIKTLDYRLSDEKIAESNLALLEADSSSTFEQAHRQAVEESFFQKNDDDSKNMENYNLLERATVRAIQATDFGLLGAATVGSGASALYFNSGRPVMGAISGLAAAAAAAPQWLPLVKAKLNARKLQSEKDPKLDNARRRLEHVRSQNKELLDKAFA